MRRLYYLSRTLLRHVRYALIRKQYQSLHFSASVSRRALVYGSSHVSLAENVVIHSNAIIQCTLWNSTDNPAGQITIGDRTVVQPFAYLWSQGGNIVIGADCSINAFCILYGQGGLSIGNNVRIAAHTVIVPGKHDFDRTDIPIAKQGYTMQGITIEDDVWIGAGTRILDGVTITTGCVIGAGAVVTKSTEPFGVYVGMPARRLKDRGEAEHSTKDS